MNAKIEFWMFVSFLIEGNIKKTLLVLINQKANLFY